MYRVSQEYLRYFYSMIELLLTVHVLTDNPELRTRADTELFYNLAQMRNIYAEDVANGTAGSLPESHRPPGNCEGSLWGHSALELQSQVNRLQAQVVVLSERLTKINSSPVYQSLVKMRNLLNTIKP